ncbi:MAG: hypothetical protein K0R60_37 [Microbacterium sp.]|jgi:hypothetical protein|nr:hypothetical protein [Microbacterium sp.]
MMTLATIKGTVLIGISSAQGVEVAEFTLPVQVDAEARDPGVVRYSVGPDSLGHAIAAALREVADRVDPDVPNAAPADLPADLEPGWVVLACPDCDATAVGRPGESIEHADGGAHVHHMSYGLGQ